MFTLETSQWAGTRAELDARIAAFVAAKDAHRFTVNVPAPTEDPIVERLAASGEEYQLRSELEPEPEPEE